MHCISKIALQCTRLYYCRNVDPLLVGREPEPLKIGAIGLLCYARHALAGTGVWPSRAEVYFYLFGEGSGASAQAKKI